MKIREELTILILLGAAVFLIACDGNGSAEMAAPDFCPTHLAQSLEVAPETGNVPPMAYYQRITTAQDTPLSITLYACDPNDAETSEGLSWRQPALDGEEGPSNGTLSAHSGIYPEGGVISYTPNPGFVGSDSFTYLVDDGVVEGNTAQILISVTAAPLTDQRIYFGGRDDQNVFHLWSHDGSTPISTVSGSAQALTFIDIKLLQEGVPFGSRIFYIGADSSYEALYPLTFNPVDRTFEIYSQYDPMSNAVEYDGILYMNAMEESAPSSYLWAFSESGNWSTVSGTDGIYPNNLAVFNGRLFFAGDTGGSNIQIWSYDSTGGTLDIETSTGTSLWPNGLTACNGRLYFNGQSGAFATSEFLWSFDDVSPAVTVSSRAVNPYNLICFAGKLYFTARDAQNLSVGAQLWAVDGVGVVETLTSVNTGTGFWPAFNENFATVAGGELYLKGYDDTSTGYIWVHDGASSLTTVSGSAGINPFYTTAFDDQLFFRSGYTGYDQLWSYDPATGGLTVLSDVDMGLSPQGFVVYPP